jgi:hypothetical protein
VGRRYLRLELCLGSPSEANTRSALHAVWQYDALEGPFANRDKEPSDQAIVSTGTNNGRLYGVAQIRGVRVPCGTYAVRPPEDEANGDGTADYLELYFPLSALSLVFPVGSFPFGSCEAARDWRAALDAWFLRFLRRQRGGFRFEVGIIGWETDLISANVAALKAREIPAERFEGIVLPGEDDLEWYPPTRHDLMTFP